MSQKTIITIGRQFGSGGREIGCQLAQRLGIPFYDKELLELAAKESGIMPELFERNDEKPINSLLYSLSTLPYAGVQISAPDMMPISQQLFLAQFEAIRKVAAAGGCVIVGRCADYVLREDPNCINLFIHAPLETRISAVQEGTGLEPAKAKDLIVKTDKRRAAYYNYYADRRWGAIDTYHLAVDSSVLGAQATAALLEQFVKSR